MTESTKKMEFKTELKQLLYLITHSLYSNKEIFLRELISNAGDAINKMRFDSLDQQDDLEGNKDWKIKIIINKELGTLTLSDNGIGMSAEDVEHAFDVFYQGHSSTFKGTGLGLALSKELIIAHNGNIIINSKKGNGTCFTIILPFTSTFILQNTLNLGLQMGTIIAAFFILFPIVFCFGMVSPLIIFLTSQQYKNSGKNASVVYTVSTVGGILFALLTGLYLVTTMGVQYSHFFIGGLLFVTTLITFLISKKN